MFFDLVPARFADGEEKFAVQNAKRGESASLRCKSVGDQPLEIKWSKDKTPIDVKDSDRYDHYESKTELGVNSELLIRTTDRNDGGLYSCLVKNEHGEAERTIKLHIVEVPEATTDVRVTEVWSKSATISWSAPKGSTSQLAKYVIRIWLKPQKGQTSANKLREIEVKPSSNVHMLKDLSPGTEYAVSVVAYNEIGPGEPSLPVFLSTAEEEPSGAPVDVRVDAKGSKSVLVHWRPPPRHDWNGNITGYYIYYRPYDVSQPFTKTVKAHPNRENASFPYSFLLNGLTKSKTYKISVKAFNSVGTGPSSLELTVSTLGADVPNAPQFQGYSITSASSVKLTWRVFNSDLPQLTGYTLYTKRNDLELFTNILPLPPGHQQFVLNNLEPGIKYTFHVSATNNYGESELSEPLEVNLVSSPLGITFFLAESNMMLLCALMIAVVSIAIAILVTTVYIRRYKQQAIEEIQRYETLRRYQDKCNTMAMYSSVPADGNMPLGGQVTIRSTANSQSSGGSGPYEGLFNTSNQEEPTIRRLSQAPKTVPILTSVSLPPPGITFQTLTQKPPLDLSESIYDDAPA